MSSPNLVQFAVRTPEDRLGVTPPKIGRRKCAK